MEVIDEGSQWLLFRRDDELLLDVSCSHSAVGYSVLIRLKPEEEAGYAGEGRAYLDRLAQAIQQAGPGAGQQRRDFYRIESMTTEAFEKWRRRNSEQSP